MDVIRDNEKGKVFIGVLLRPDSLIYRASHRGLRFFIPYLSSLKQYFIIKLYNNKNVFK